MTYCGDLITCHLIIQVNISVHLAFWVLSAIVKVRGIPSILLDFNPDAMTLLKLRAFPLVSIPVNTAVDKFQYMTMAMTMITMAMTMII